MKTKDRAEVRDLVEGRGDSCEPRRDRFWKLQSTLGRGGKRHGTGGLFLCRQQCPAVRDHFSLVGECSCGM